MRLVAWAQAGGRFLLARPCPLVVGLAITDTCNLQCRHCRVANITREHMTFDRVRQVLGGLRTRGARVLYLEGGEPYLWRDGTRRMRDIVALARALGFLRVHVYTNATRPLDDSPDFQWISIDGPPDLHRAIRGIAAERAFAHLRAFSGPAAIVCTLNTQNVHAIPDTLEFIERELPGRRVCFFFHTPYYGIDDLFLDRPSRLQAAETIVREKRNGRPVLNSVAGIRAIARGTFRHPLPYTVVVDATGEYRCCRAVRTPEVCAHCGYATCAEMELVRHLHPSALREALRYAF